LTTIDRSDNGAHVVSAPAPVGRVGSAVLHLARSLAVTEARSDLRLPETQVEPARGSDGSEALTNAAKHLHASSVRVTAACAGDQLTIEVNDDGIGGAAAGVGTGLRGLADRVEALGGRLTVSSPPGCGTRLIAEIPCG